MRRFLRSSRRLFGVIAIIAIYSITWKCGWLWHRRDPERRVRWRRKIFRSWCRSLLAVLGVRLRLAGSPPAAPFFLVCNHLGYFDILVLASQLDAVFVARADVAGWPVLGRLCRGMDTIFIDRTLRRDVPRVLEETVAAIDRGDGVVIFPEGTSSRGDTVLPFLPSLLAAPTRLGKPVLYASLSYSTPQGDSPAHRSVCWWGDMTFPDHLWNLMGLSRVDVLLTFGDRPIESSNRKQLAVDLREAVLGSFTPVVEPMAE